MNSGMPLVPQPKIWLRATILVLLIAFAWMDRVRGFARMCLRFDDDRALRLVSPPCGSVQSTTNRNGLSRFIPVHGRRMRLDKMVQIETDVETKMGMGTGLGIGIFVGVWDVLIIWLFDWIAPWLVPWFGGDYKIWLRTSPTGGSWPGKETERVTSAETWQP